MSISILHNSKGKGIGRQLCEMQLKNPTDYVISLGKSTHIVNINKKYEKPLIDKYNELVKEKKCENREMYIRITRITTITYNDRSINIEDLAVKENCVATFTAGFYLFTFPRGQKEIIVMFNKFTATSNVIIAPMQLAPSAPMLPSSIQPMQAVPSIAAPDAESNAKDTPSSITPPAHFLNLIPEENRVCSICTDIITADPYLTKCYHLFHKTCIEKWFTTKDNTTTCPVCRVG